MIVQMLPADAGFAQWRGRARALLAAGTPPEAVEWRAAGDADLFGEGVPPPAPTDAAPAATSVPRAFVTLAESVIRHSAPERFALLYRLLWRLSQGEKELLAIHVDPDVHRAAAMARQVERDAYKMKAYLRFREIVQESGQPHSLAWFEPAHRVVELVAPFFTERFAALRWSILTPGQSAHWDGQSLTYGPGRPRSDVPTEDALTECWKTYYASIFNPARLKVDAMLAQAPKKYWKNMEEMQLAPAMIREASLRARTMIAAAPSEPAQKGRVRVARPAPAPLPTSLEEVATALAACRRCPLWQSATQAVAGEGPLSARIMLVGEQPGDQEDLAGRPFVGPAGQLLDRAMRQAGMDRNSVYVTNAVKHFKYTPRGKLRLHQKPSAREVDACGDWLGHEIEIVKPDLIVALGATAARGLLKREVPVTKLRGSMIEEAGRKVLVTYHPAAILRHPDPAMRNRLFEELAEDLGKARGLDRHAAGLQPREP